MNVQNPPKKQAEFEPAGMSGQTNYKVPVIHGFPSPFVSSTVKASSEYGIAYANKMLAEWEYSNGGLLNSRARRYHIARLYSMGMQSENQYKNIVSSNKRVKTLNLIYRVQSVIPKYLKTLIEQFMELEETSRCTAIDPFSVSAKDEQKATAEMALEHKPFVDEMEGATGVQSIPPELKFESQQAINLYFDLFFKQKKELAFEQALEFINNENDKDQQKREHLRNFAVYNKSAVKTTLNPDGTITKRVVDIEKFISSFSKKDNYSDIIHAGELLDMSISQLRVLANGELSEQQLYELYCKSDNKPVKTPFDNRWVTAYERPYDSHQIQVLHFEFLSTDKVVKEERQTKYGTTLIGNQKDTYKLKAGEIDKKLLEKNIQYRYSGYYIPSIKKTFQYGRDKMIERSFNMQKLSKCNLTYDVFEPDNYNMNSKSWVEHIMSAADMMQVTWLKIQAMVAKAKPAGIAVDIRGLEGVMNGKGGEVFKPLEILSIYEDTGNILFRSQTADGRGYQGKPIEEIKNGISGAELANLVNVYNQCIAVIQNNTGMNPAADGSLNLNQASVGGAKIAMNQSNRATRYIYDAYLSLRQRSDQKAANQCQLSVMYDMNNNYWDSAIGKYALEAIKEGNDPLELSDYGINIEALPDDNKRNEIMMAVQDGVNKGVISQKDAFVIREMKNYKNAILYLDYIEKKNKEEAAQAAQKNVEMQMQAQSQSAQDKATGDAKVNKAKTDGRLQEIDTEYTLKDHLQDKAFYQKMVEIGKMSLEDYNLRFGLDMRPQQNAAMAQAVTQPQQEQIDPQAEEQAMMEQQMMQPPPEQIQEVMPQEMAGVIQ